MNKKVFSILTGLLFLAFVSIFGFTHMIPREFAIYFLTISAITAIAYGIDKRAAILDDSRIPEVVLHGFSLFGGWPGALIAQQLFRHKTVKMKFRFVFWITVVANLAIFYRILITPEGTALMKSVM